MPFTFNAVDLCVLTISDKPWTCSKEVCKALQYNKKTADIIKAFCSKKNFAHKYQLSEFTTAGNFVDWPKDSRKDDYYTDEAGMYEPLFSSQQPKAKDFRKHCCNVLFPHVRQQLTNKMEEDHQQTITGIQEEHQLVIHENGQAVSLLNDNLQE